MKTLILAAALLMQTEPTEKAKPPKGKLERDTSEFAEEINKAQEAKEVTEEEGVDYGVAGRGPLFPVTINEELSVRPLGLETWLIVHAQPWAANSLLAQMPDGTLVLCDTPYDDETTGQLVGWMRKTFGDEVKIVVVNSHFHADALGGNGALLKAGAVTYGSKLSAVMLEKRGAKLKQELLARLEDKQELKARFKDAQWLAPAEQFDPAKGLELTFGDEKLVLYYPGPGHSPDNIVAWFPKRKMLFGGCLVRSGSGIPNVADADLVAWPASIEKLRRFDARTVVPGHGRVGGPDLLDHTIAVLAEHTAQAQKLRQAPKSQQK